MTQVTHYWQVACSVCNSIKYGFGDWPLDIINPGIKCDQEGCDGNGYIIGQTTDKDTFDAQNESLERYSASR
jgi:hypothetical protein